MIDLKCQGCEPGSRCELHGRAVTEREAALCAGRCANPAFREPLAVESYRRDAFCAGHPDEPDCAPQVKTVVEPFRLRPVNAAAIEVGAPGVIIESAQVRWLPAEPTAPRQPDPAAGLPGDELATIIKAEFGAAAWEGCTCAARQRQMNLWGCAGCREQAEVIAVWLMEAFATMARRVPDALEQRMIGELVKAAIDRAESKAKERA